MINKKRLSQVRRELEEKYGDDARLTAKWGIEDLALLCGIPIDQIEDDENITDEPQECSPPLSDTNATHKAND